MAGYNGDTERERLKQCDETHHAFGPLLDRSYLCFRSAI